MELTKQEALKRLSSESNLINSLGIGHVKTIPVEKVQVITDTPAKNTPPVKSKEVRTLAAVCSLNDGIKETAKNLNLTEQQVSSARNTDDKSLAKKIQDTADEVSELALTRLLDSLGLLSLDNISGEKPKDVSTIAANLSKIYSNVRRGGNGNESAGVQFVIHAPNMKSLNSFDTVSV